MNNMNEEQMVKKKRYALLLACKDSDYVIKMYGGYFNVFVNAFGDENDEWDSFRVFEGQFPEIKDLDKYDGYVISGSPCDAYGNELWILQLCLLLQTLNLMQKKLLGICFGHQVLCRAFGGKIGKACSGWDIGLRKVSLVEDLPSYFGTFLTNCVGDNIVPLSILECHQDEVTEVPDGAKVFGSSDKTRVEVFGIGDNILGIQGHPEYTKDIIINLIDRLVNTNYIEIDFGEDVKWRLEEGDPDRKSWGNICKSFLKGTS